MHTMGIDIGTTTISVVLLDVDSGELIGRRTIEHRAFCKGILPEQRVQDPERIWMLVSNALQELVEMHGKPCGIGLTGQMHGMLYVDETGRAVSPLYTWQDRGGDQIWKDGLTYAQFLKASAGDAASGYGLTTHYYLQQTGRIPKTAAKMTTISDYMIMRLTGNREPVLAADMAASWGCFDLEKNGFRLEALQSVGMDVSCLPRICTGHEIAGRTEEGIPVLCSLGDNQASVIGSVQSIQDTVLLNVGTGSQVSMGISGYQKCDGNIELRPCLPGRYILAGAGLCGGRAYAMLEQFYREAAGIGSKDLYDRMLGQAQEFLDQYGREQAWKICTAFSGTRQDPEACGRIEGIRTENFHPGAMTAGMLLGILEELYGYYEEMCRITGRRAAMLAGSGNGLRKNALMRRLAEEMFGMPVKVPVYEEEAACGAALHAMAGIGAVASVEDAQKKIVYL